METGRNASQPKFGTLISSALLSFCKERTILSRVCVVDGGKEKMSARSKEEGARDTCLTRPQMGDPILPLSLTASHVDAFVLQLTSSSTQPLAASG